MGDEARVLCGDARAVLAQLPDASVDAIVTDPPAGIAFMDQTWDNPWEFALNGHGFTDGAQRLPAPAIASARNPMCRLCHKHKRGWKQTPGCTCPQPDFDDADRNRRARDTFVASLAAVFKECRRVLKPGGYALVWALPRTSHWTAMALEEAGFEIRDSIHHLFGSGFPKSKSCLKPAHEVWWLAKAPGPLRPLQIDTCRLPTNAGDETGRPKGSHGAFPFSDDAWGNGPLTYAGGHAGGRWPPNVLFAHHPDCQPAGVRRVRVAYSQPMERTSSASTQQCARTKHDRPVGYASGDGYETVDAWTCVDGCPIKALDEQAGPRTSGARHHDVGEQSYGNWRAYEQREEPRVRPRASDYAASAGNASRFFPTFAPDPEDAHWVPFRYEPKASRREREEGLDDLALHEAGCYGQCAGDGRGRQSEHTPARHHHPTVKPIALMRWLCRLVTPPGGLVLDPFCGSGSTLVACVREGFHCIGIEQDEQYCEIARRRVAYEQERQSGPLFRGVATG